MARRQPTVHRRQLMEPQCTHLHMVRLHDADALCCMCHRPGQLGWVYQCTQDYEELIEHDVAKGGFVNTTPLTLASPTTDLDSTSLMR